MYREIRNSSKISLLYSTMRVITCVLASTRTARWIIIKIARIISVSHTSLVSFFHVLFVINGLKLIDALEYLNYVTLFFYISVVFFKFSMVISFNLILYLHYAQQYYIAGLLPQNSSFFKSLFKIPPTFSKSSIIWNFLLKFDYSKLRSKFITLKVSHPQIVHLAELCKHTRKFFLYLYLYTILTNLLHTFMNSFQGVSSDIIICIFSPIFCSIHSYFIFRR